MFQSIENIKFLTLIFCLVFQLPQTNFKNTAMTKQHFKIELVALHNFE